MGYPDPDRLPMQSATAAAGAVTLHSVNGEITSEALTTAGQAGYSLALTNRFVGPESSLDVNVSNGTNTQGRSAVGRVTLAAGLATIIINNEHATEALNGTIKIRFKVRNRFPNS